MCAPKCVFVHTEICICWFVCVCECVCACCFANACLQFLSLSGKDIAEGDKQTHLTLCPHGNQGTEQKKRWRERQEAWERGCKQMLRDEERRGMRRGNKATYACLVGFQQIQWMAPSSLVQPCNILSHIYNRNPNHVTWLMLLLSIKKMWKILQNHTYTYI